MITKPDFEAALVVEGYVEIETKMLPPRPANGDQGHHYAVKGLVLDGAFCRCAGRSGRRPSSRASFLSSDRRPAPRGDQPRGRRDLRRTQVLTAPVDVWVVPSGDGARYLVPRRTSRRMEPVLLLASSTGLCDRSLAKSRHLIWRRSAPRPDVVGGVASVANFGRSDVCKWDRAPSDLQCWLPTDAVIR
jgi:hypothetical protein